MEGPRAGSRSGNCGQLLVRRLAGQVAWADFSWPILRLLGLGSDTWQAIGPQGIRNDILTNWSLDEYLGEPRSFQMMVLCGGLRQAS